MKMNMSNEYKEQLQRQYNSFVKLDEKGFFLGLADYVKFIVETPSLFEIVKNLILPQYKKDTEEFKNLKEKAKRELKKSGERLVKEIIKIILPTIKEVAKESQKDWMQLFRSPLEVIHNPTLVQDIFRFQDRVYKNITPRRATKLISLWKPLKRRYLSSQTCLKYSREKTYQEHLQEITIWGSWHELKLVYDLIHQRKKIEQEIEGGEDLSSRVALMFLGGEMDTVLKKRPLLPIFRKFDISWRNFTKNNHIIHLNRVHYYFMRQIESEALEIDKTMKWYNPKDKSIFLNGKLYKPRKEMQAKVIRNLIGKHQEENNKGIVLKEGKRTPENVFATEIGLTLKQFKSIKKQLRRTFKDEWGSLLKIDSNSEGILLILTK